MQVTTGRKATMIAIASIAALTIATGSAFAGRGVGGDNGNKYGNDNKKQTGQCTDGYNYDYAGYYGSTAWAADLNNNSYICVKWAGNNGGYSFIDDISN